MDIPLERLKNLVHLESSSVLNGIFSVYGDFGVGKTVLSLQIALNTIIEGNKVIYIYSKPIFPLKILSELMKRYNLTLESEQYKNFVFINLNTYRKLYEIVLRLEFIVLEEINRNLPLTKLVIIDSITELYRMVLNPNKKEVNIKQNFQLNHILGNLSYLNSQYGVEILLINEISSKLEDQEYITVQSGGLVMDYWVKYSLEIIRTNVLNERKIVITKHPKQENTVLTYKLGSTGFNGEV